MSSGTVYLIAEYQSGFKVAANATVISLAPHVSFQLEEAKVPFSILQDFYEEKALRQDEEALFWEEFEWVKRLDLFLAEMIAPLKKRDIRPAYYHFSKLKYLWDTWIVQARELNFLIERLGPQKIIYVGKSSTGNEGEGEQITFDSKKMSSPGYQALVRDICGNSKIPYQVIWLEKSHFQDQANPSSQQIIPPIVTLIKEMLKPFFNFFRYHKYHLLTSLAIKKEDAPGVLMLDAGTYPIDKAIEQFLRRRWKVFLKSHGEIKKLHCLLESVIMKMEYGASSVDISSAVNGLAKLDWFWQSLKKKAGIDLQTILEPSMKGFIVETVPRMIREYDCLEKFVEKEGIRLMVARGSSGANYPAALNLARNQRDRIKSVCFQHACGPTHWLDWIHGELDYFDFFLTSDGLSAEAFKEYKQSGLFGSCEVGCAPYFLKKIASTSRIQKKNRLVLLYVPAKAFTGISKLNTYLYHPTFLYRLQKALLDFFATKTDYWVIFKYLDSMEWMKSSLFGYLKKQNYKNILLRTGTPQRYFPQTNRVLFDFPSTGLFEATAAGLPVMSLYPSSVQLMPKMAEFFGECLQSFTCPEEAITLVKSYLEEPRQRYIRQLSFPESGFFDPPQNLSF